MANRSYNECVNEIKEAMQQQKLANRGKNRESGSDGSSDPATPKRKGKPSKSKSPGASDAAGDDDSEDSPATPKRNSKQARTALQPPSTFKDANKYRDGQAMACTMGTTAG